MKSFLSQRLWLLLLLTSLPLAVRAQAKVPVVLSTDIGNEIDDQWAVAYLLTQPAFDVRGILSAHAPSLPDPSAEATLAVLKDEVEHRLGMRQHPPLIEGANLPMPDRSTPQPSAASRFLIKESRGFTPDHRLNVVVIGAATDAASALLMDPSLADRIRVVGMAFRDLSPGGAREYNEENDPAAWAVLLASRVPLAVGTGDTCERYLGLNYAQAEHLLAGHGPVAAWLWSDYRAWYYRNVKPLRVDDFSKPWVIWDLITLAYLRGLASVEPHARPRLDERSMRFEPGHAGATLQQITRVRTPQLWAEFTAGLDAWQRRQAERSKGDARATSIPSPSTGSSSRRRSP